MAKKLGSVEETLAGIQTPDVSDSDLGEQLEEKIDRLGKIKTKLDKIMERADDIQNKIDEICAPLKQMGDKEVISPDL